VEEYAIKLVARLKVLQGEVCEGSRAIWKPGGISIRVSLPVFLLHEAPFVCCHLENLVPDF
jgi:hypothetical protein